MTTYYKEYDFNAEQRALLWDLIVYEISQGWRDEPAVNVCRTSELNILQMLNYGRKVEGDDCIIFTINNIVKKCRDVKEQALQDVLNKYSEGVIEGFLEIASLNGLKLNSTNNF